LRGKLGLEPTTEDAPLTVAVFLRQWLDEMVDIACRPATATNYRVIVENHIIPELGHLLLTDLRPTLVQQFLNKVRSKGKAANTVRNVRSVLRRALNIAVQWEHINRNPAVPVAVPRPSQYEVEPLQVEQLQQLFAVLKDHPLEVLYHLAILLGLRRGELLGLRLSDVDLDKNVLRVRGAIQTVPGRTVRVEPKTRGSSRALPIPPALRPLLEKHIAQQRELHGDEASLFTTKNGTPILPRNLSRQFKTVLRLAGLPEKVRLHDLRHTAATMLLTQGADIRTVMGILGHSQASTTLNIYAHIVPEATRQAVKQYEQTLFGSGTDNKEALDGSAL
jgi:integrase